MITPGCGILLILIRMPILRLFDSDPAVLYYADRYVLLLLPFQWVFAIFNGMVCYVNGLGMVRYTMVVNLLMLWAVRISAGAETRCLGRYRGISLFLQVKK